MTAGLHSQSSCELHTVACCVRICACMRTRSRRQRCSKLNLNSRLPATQASSDTWSATLLTSSMSPHHTGSHLPAHQHRNRCSCLPVTITSYLLHPRTAPATELAAALRPPAPPWLGPACSTRRPACTSRPPVHHAAEQESSSVSVSQKAWMGRAVTPSVKYVSVVARNYIRISDPSRSHQAPHTTG